MQSERREKSSSKKSSPSKSPTKQQVVISPDVDEKNNDKPNDLQNLAGENVEIPTQKDREDPTKKDRTISASAVLQSKSNSEANPASPADSQIQTGTQASQTQTSQTQTIQPIQAKKKTPGRCRSRLSYSDLTKNNLAWNSMESNSVGNVAEQLEEILSGFTEESTEQAIAQSMITLKVTPSYKAQESQATNQASQATTDYGVCNNNSGTMAGSCLALLAAVKVECNMYRAKYGGQAEQGQQGEGGEREQREQGEQRAVENKEECERKLFEVEGGKGDQKWMLCQWVEG